MPRRQPRKPSIGLNSCSCLHALAESSRPATPSFFARSACCSRRVRQELVQRRIEQADRRRAALQRLEDAVEVLALVRQQLGERRLRGPRASRRGSSRASRRCGRLRRTCARCGTGRCPRRRTRSRSAPARACRRWCGPTCAWLVGTTSSAARSCLNFSVFCRLHRLVDQHLRRPRVGAVFDLAGEDLAGEAVDRDPVAFLEASCRRP